MRRILNILLLSAAIPVVASAQIQSLQVQNLQNRINFSVSAEREVSNDLHVAVISAEARASEQSEAANAVNEAMAWATEQARQVPGIRIQPGEYSTRTVTSGNSRRIVAWSARQLVRLESSDASTLSNLLGQLQERIAVAELSQSLAPSTRDALEEELIVEVLARFNRRAQLIAGEMGRDYELVSLSVDNIRGLQTARNSGSGTYGADAIAPPPIETGIQNISISASGVIELIEAN